MLEGLQNLWALVNVQVCVHYDGKLYEFVPWNGVVRWEMSPWGYWYITAENETHMVNLFSFSDSFSFVIIVTLWLDSDTR